MTTHHAAIWIDHNEARILRLEEDSAGYTTEHLEAHDRHTHGKKGDGHRHPTDAHFLAKVVEAIATCDEVMILGPAHTKDELKTHIAGHRPALAQRLIVETSDRLTDGELADRARRTFRAADRMRGIHVETR